MKNMIIAATMLLALNLHAEETNVEIYKGYSKLDPTEECQLSISRDSNNQISMVKLSGYGQEWNSDRKNELGEFSVEITRDYVPGYFHLGFTQISSMEKSSI